mgnify:CR=1 FL=1
MFLSISIVTISGWAILMHWLMNNIFKLPITKPAMVICAFCALLISIAVPRILTYSPVILKIISWLLIIVLVFSWVLSYCDNQEYEDNSNNDSKNN